MYSIFYIIYIIYHIYILHIIYIICHIYYISYIYILYYTWGSSTAEAIAYNYHLQNKKQPKRLQLPLRGEWRNSARWVGSSWGGDTRFLKICCKVNFVRHRVSKHVSQSCKFLHPGTNLHHQVCFGGENFLQSSFTIYCIAAEKLRSCPISWNHRTTQGTFFILFSYFQNQDLAKDSCPWEKNQPWHKTRLVWMASRPPWPAWWRLRPQRPGCCIAVLAKASIVVADRFCHVYYVSLAYLKIL